MSARNCNDSFGLSLVNKVDSRLDGSLAGWERAPDGLDRGDACGTSGRDDDDEANVVKPENGRSSAASSWDTIAHTDVLYWVLSWLSDGCLQPTLPAGKLDGFPSVLCLRCRTLLGPQVSDLLSRAFLAPLQPPFHQTHTHSPLLQRTEQYSL